MAVDFASSRLKSRQRGRELRSVVQVVVLLRRWSASLLLLLGLAAKELLLGCLRLATDG